MKGWQFAALVGVFVGVPVLLSLLFGKESQGVSYNSIPLRPALATRYKNTEIREIEYNSDGLPVRIVITRDATTT